MKNIYKNVWRVVLVAVFSLYLGLKSYAQTDYFIQDFSQPVGYTSSTPNNTQFNVLGTSGSSSFTTTGGNLSMTRTIGGTSSQVYFIRNANFSPVPSTLYLEVDINVPIVTTPINGAAIFNVGQNFASSGTAAPNANLFARFSINLGVNNTYQIRNTPGLASGVTANSTTFSNTQTVKVIVAMNNKPDSSITYFDPRNAAAPQIVLQPGTYDIWVNNVPLVLGRGKVAGPTGNVTLTNFNFLFNSGEGTITMDNLRIRDISGVLPVKLTYFNAEAIGNQVELGWETTWEKNSREFVIQRSNDLREFGDIGRIAAAGEAEGRRQYSFTDINPLPGANYYRLRVVDKDDTYEFSKVKDVVVRSDLPMLLVASNPTSGDLIRLRTSLVDFSALKLTNLMGQNVNFRIHQNSEGYTELIPASVLAPGMYFLSLYQDGFQTNTKVLIQ
jgi:hypothetical protein